MIQNMETKYKDEIELLNTFCELYGPFIKYKNGDITKEELLVIIEAIISR